MKYFFFLFIIILNGCTALHVPQSEIILIEKPSEEEQIAAGISINSGLWNKELPFYAREEYKEEGLQDKIASRNFYGISLTGLVSGSRNSAMGFSLGSGGLGLDFTQGFFDRIYITASGNMARNVEGIIQTPVYRTRKSGLAIGGFYRNERHGLLDICESYLCIENKIGSYFRISAYGLRLSQYVEDIEDKEARLRIRFSIGYSPEFQGVVIIGGIQAALRRKNLNRNAF